MMATRPDRTPQSKDVAPRSTSMQRSRGPSSSTVPRVSVVIPNWNGINHLPECLDALAAQVFTDHEVIVVDNASTDGSVSWVQDNYPQVRVLRRPDNGGFSKAVNTGIGASHSEYVALLNNDTAVAAEWLEALVQALEDNPTFDFAASKMILYDQPERLNAAGDVYALHRLAGKNRGLGRPVRRYAKMQRVLGACAGAALYRRLLFDQVGLFDEGFFLTAEDTDFNLRCLIAGKRCLYVPRAHVRHKLRATIGEAPLGDLGRVAARNEALVAARDLPAVLLPFLPALWVCRLLRQTLLVRPSRLRLVPLVVRRLPGQVSAELEGLRLGFANRTDVWSHRTIGSLEIIRWLVKGSGSVHKSSLQSAEVVGL